MRTFELEATPAIARRLLALQAVRPNLHLSDEIIELAKQDTVEQTGLDPKREQLVRDLLDMNLRAYVVMPLHWQCRELEWEAAVVMAAKLSAVSDVIIPRDFSSRVMAEQMAAVDIRVHRVEPDQYPQCARHIPRDALLLWHHCDTASFNIGLDYYRTLIFTSMRSPHARLYPKFPSFPEFISDPKVAGPLGTRSIATVAPVMSATLAIQNLSKDDV